ncbi:exodeoxyribonuclease VII small subunit [Undibacterium sp. TJN19]|uniref:exodeoxyribonuclease VII small subunit n=1 Tax=Undibacterium sp. TJN19 TaxID=3413055 RepID=UPI003BF0D9DD
MTKKQVSENDSAVPVKAGLSFEAAMAELTALVASMEAGELPLEASVSAYQRGSELIKYCAAQLDKVEQQVKVLEAGMLKPFASDNGDGAV